MHCFLQLSADLHSSAHSDGEASDFLLLAGCAWTSARVSAESEPGGFHGPALAASRPAETSTDLRGGAGRPGHLVSPQRLRLLAGCVAYIQRCRSAASLGNHFGIRPRSQHRIGAHFGWRSTTARLPSPAHAWLRYSTTPRK